MGLLPGSFSVHADGEPERLPVWLSAVRAALLPGGWAADDGVALLFHGTKMVKVVSSRPGTAALRVDAVAGQLVRHRIEPELLGVALDQPARRAGRRRHPRVARSPLRRRPPLLGTRGLSARREAGERGIELRPSARRATA